MRPTIYFTASTDMIWMIGHIGLRRIMDSWTTRACVRSIPILMAMIGAPAGADAAILRVEIAGSGSSQPCPVPRDSIDYGDIASALFCAESGDELVLGAGTWTGPENRDLHVTKSLVVRGAGVDSTILDAQSQGRHFLAQDTTTVLSLEGITLRDGLIEVDPAVGSGAVGGSVAFGGDTLHIHRCRFENNAVRFTEPGGGYAGGGAISAARQSKNPGHQVRISDSIFVGNTVHNQEDVMNGAAIEVGGYSGGASGIGLSIERSSFTDNRSLPGFFAGRAVVSFGSDDPAAKAVITNSLITSHDGANYALSATRADIVHSTIVGFDSDAILVFPGESVISATGSMILGVGAGDACRGGSIVSAGHNLDSDGTCGLMQAGDLSNVSDAGVELSSDAASQPFLALLAGSPAIDAAAASCLDAGGSPLSTDQLGLPRPRGEACDIGAIEFDSRVAILRVEATGTATSAPCPVPRDAVDYSDIATAVACAQQGDEIEIGEGQWRGPRNRDIEITKTLSIRGAGAGVTLLDAESQGRHFLAMAPAISLTLQSMTLHHGLVEEQQSNSFAAGGSILFGGRSLLIDRCRIEDNDVRNIGGTGVPTAGAVVAARLSSDPGEAVTIRDSVFLRNTIHSEQGPMNGAALAVGDYIGGEDHVGLLIDRSSFGGNHALPALFSGGAVVSFSSADGVAKALLTNTLVVAESPSYAFTATRADLQYSTLVGYNTPALVVFDESGPVTAIGSMLLAFEGGTACPMGGVVSAGHNLDTDDTCALDAATDQAAVFDPHLAPAGPPGDDGQFYLDLLPDSPAIDAGAVDCVDLNGAPIPTDQIGRPRPLGTACDIGSIEFDVTIFRDEFEPAF